jgi:hypothetical protein
MPYVLPRPPRKARLLATLGVALLIAIAAPATAGAACPTTATSQPFQQFGDSNYYSMIPNGSFESGTTGWTLRDASVVGSASKYKVSGSGDVSSLAMKGRGEAVSPSFCVDETIPTFRFLADTTTGYLTDMNVHLRYKDSYAVLHDITLVSLDDGPFASWAPTAILPIQAKLPLWQRNSTLTVQLVFDPNFYGNDWSIDDVYVDPYRR